MEVDTGGLTLVSDWSLEILKVMATLVGIAAFVVIVAGLLRSIWSVSFGGVSLIHPIAGTENLGIRLNGLLADYMQQQQEEWREFVEEIRGQTRAIASDENEPLLDQGSRAIIEGTTNRQDKIVAPGSATTRPIGPIGVGGTTISPDVFIALLDEIRSHVARNTIHGEYFMLGNEARFTVTIGGLFRRSHHITLMRPITRSPAVGRLSQLEQDACQLLVQDMAFQVLKHRLRSESQARTWQGFRSLLQGYLHQARFALTSLDEDANKAIEAYQCAIDKENELANAIQLNRRENHLAHFRLANLLYNRYRSCENRRALDSYWIASTSKDQDLSAIAYSGAARAAVQAFTRFGDPKRDELLQDADFASQAAIDLDPGLADSHLARGFVLQVNEDWDAALKEVETALELEDGGPIEWRSNPRKRPDDRFGRSLETVGTIAGATSNALKGSAVTAFADVPTEFLRWTREWSGARRPGHIVDVPRSNRQVISMALNNRGYIYMRRSDGQDDIAEAERSFSGAIKTLRANKMAWANMAEICRLKGDFPEAVRHFKQALTLDPAYVNAHNELALLYLWEAGKVAATESDADQNKLMVNAAQSHLSAVSFLSEGPDHHRRLVEKIFDDGANEYGFAIDRSGSEPTVTRVGS